MTDLNEQTDTLGAALSRRGLLKVSAAGAAAAGGIAVGAPAIANLLLHGNSTSQYTISMSHNIRPAITPTTNRWT